MKRSVLLVVVFLGLVTCPLAGQLRERLYQEACDGGSMLECNLLGIMYETGEGPVQPGLEPRRGGPGLDPAPCHVFGATMKEWVDDV